MNEMEKKGMKSNMIKPRFDMYKKKQCIKEGEDIES